MAVAKGTCDEERMSDGDRTFIAGSTRYDVLPQTTDASHMKAVVMW
jgi:hypothetical protein